MYPQKHPEKYAKRCILSDFRKFCPIIHERFEIFFLILQRFFNKTPKMRIRYMQIIRHILCLLMLQLSLLAWAAPVDSLLEIFDRKPTLKNVDAFFGYLYEQEFTDAPRMYRSTPPLPPMDTVKALVWYWAGEWYYDTQQYAEAERNLLRALELMQYADQTSYSDNLAMLGLVEMRQSKYEEALQYMKRCYEIDMQSGDAERICSSLNTIAGTLLAAGDPTEAMKYELRAIEYAKKAGSPVRLAVVYGMASEIEHALHDDQKALSYADSACVMEATTGNNRKMMVRLSQKASILNGLKRYAEAEEILSTVIPYFRESGDQLSLAISLNKVGIALHGLGRNDEALTCLYEAIDICQHIGNIVNEAYAQREVYDILFRDKPDEARVHLVRYHQLKDSLYSQATAEQIARFNAEFQLNEYVEENSRLRQRDKVFTGVAIAAVLIIGLIVIFAIRWYRKKQTQIDDQLNALMQEVNRFRAQEPKTLPAKKNDSKTERKLSANERSFLENIMHTTSQMMETETVTVEKIADKLFMTPKTLNRRVIELTGISTKQYLLLIQLEQSRKILRQEPETSILDVALRCGFDNANTFSGAFKRIYHTSPSDFRRNDE